jgi:hypothetical protein
LTLGTKYATIENNQWGNLKMFDQRAYQALWRAENAAKLKAYREANREKKRAYDREYYALPENKQLSGAAKRKIYADVAKRQTQQT